MASNGASPLETNVTHQASSEPKSLVRIHAKEPRHDGEEEHTDKQSNGTQSTATVVGGTGASPEKSPYHVFSARKKRLLVLVVSIAGLFSPLSSNIYFPALDSIADGLGISNQNILYTITIYMVIQGIAPSLWGPLSDIYGRRIIFIATFITYLAGNVGCAFSEKLVTLLAFRGLQAAGSAATISIGAGVIGDITSPEERGGYVGAFGGLRMAGQALGPVLGGLITQLLGYKAIFWFLSIFGTFTLLLILTFLPETLRRIAGNGSVQLHGLHRPLISYLHSSEKEDHHRGSSPPNKAPPFSAKKIVRPLRYLVEKDIFVTLFFGSVTYTVWSMVTSSTTFIFIRHYHLSELLLGAAFLPNGAGCVIGSVVTGKLMDRDYQRCKRRHLTWQEEDSGTEPTSVSFPYERARLRQIWFLAPLFVLGIALYGPSLALPTPTAPLVLQFFIAYASTGIFAVNSALMIDLFPAGAAGATALNNLARCLIGAVGVSFAQPMTDKVGEMGTFLILAGVVMGLSPMIWLEWRFGERWRGQREDRQERERGDGVR